jgi:biopolymer transport protein ExbB
MLEIVQAGGPVMVPIILCSIIAAAIVLERVWTLRRHRVLPKNLTAQVHSWLSSDELDAQHLQRLHQSSALGQILAAGLAHRHATREIVKEKVEDAGRHAVHELEHYLGTLGTIAAVSPLLGLLGTVLGMIQMFSALTAGGVGNPAALAGGIGQALITTAAGLMVAIPALIGHRYLRGRVDGLVVEMEKETMKFLETVLSYSQVSTELRSAEHEAAAPRKRRA